MPGVGDDIGIVGIITVGHATAACEFNGIVGVPEGVNKPELIGNGDLIKCPLHLQAGRRAVFGGGVNLVRWIGETIDLDVDRKVVAAFRCDYPLSEMVQIETAGVAIR